MIGIRYKGELLDLKPNASLSFELNNLVFSATGGGKLPGSFSFPFDIPATAHNRALLSHPDRPDKAAPFDQSGSVEVSYHNTILFVGLLKITEASVENIKVYIISNPLYDVKDTPLNELGLGGNREFASGAAVLTHAKNTALNPLDYDYIFFPVYNWDFITGTVTDAKARWQNYYDATPAAFVVDHEYPNLMPFARLDYVLSRIFLSDQYLFDNQFQTDDELKQIVLYNNRSLWTSEGLDTKINLTNHVSKTKSTDLVKAVMGAFCLGLFYNPWNRVMKLIPMRSLLGQPARHDWTKKLLYTPRVTTNGSQPEVICWEDPSDDSAHINFTKRGKPDVVDGEILSTALDAAPEGMYYVTDWHGYYLKLEFYAVMEYSTLGCAPLDTGNPKFECKFAPLHDFRINDIGPEIRIPGTVSYMQDGDPVEQSNDVPDRLAMYRGFQTLFGLSRPFGSGLPYDQDANLIGNYSLRMDGEYGVYESWWRGWHQAIRTGKLVSATLALSIAEFMNFNFEDKVRIGNQDYFLKKMRVTLTPRGLAPVEVELVSTT